MIETPKEFLMRVCKNDGNSTINYKPCEHSNEIQALPFDKALDMLNADIEEMMLFCDAVGIADKEKATQGTYNIWLKHLVTR